MFLTTGLLGSKMIENVFCFYIPMQLLKEPIIVMLLGLLSISSLFILETDVVKIMSQTLIPIS